MTGSPTARWYAVAVHARSERAAADGVVRVVDEVFLPVRLDRRAWSDRVQTVEVPLFPGYLLVRTTMSAEKRVELLKVKHVYDVVGRTAGRVDVAPSVPDVEVTSLQTLLAHERALDPVEKLQPGVAVVVVVGPLKGVRGFIEKASDGQRRLVVSIALLGRGVRTVLHADDVLEDVSV
ncbi:MAG: transcription termination/antitermination NusG family protein [Deltaproteobacteria bacterium]|nr:transcription termination/antitermination NusG family protein [Deltaproteobacteria bacterium]